MDGFEPNSGQVQGLWVFRHPPQHPQSKGSLATKRPQPHVAHCLGHILLRVSLANACGEHQAHSRTRTLWLTLHTPLTQQQQTAIEAHPCPDPSRVVKA